jgi:Flp pilus assembly protein TadG
MNRKGNAALVCNRTVKEAQPREIGAALVELAMVLPLLILLLFGIMEASWAFAQQNDVRHGAREGARSAAVDLGNTTQVGQAVCDRMDVVNPTEGITVTLTPLSASGETGGIAKIRVDANLQDLTGFFGPLFGGTVSSEVEFRTEQPAEGSPAWWNGGAPSSFPCP